jgi:hypothetical protein
LANGKTVCLPLDFLVNSRLMPLTLAGFPDQGPDMSRHEIINRLRWYLPFVGIIGVYFLIPLVVPPIPPPEWLTAPDRHIPFVPWMVIPYYWHFLLVAGSFLLPDLKEFRRTMLGLVLVSAGIYVVYLIWPVRVDLLDNLDFSRYPFTWMHETICLDYLRQNSFPSEHVVVSSIITLRMRDAFPRWQGIWLFAVGMIFLSTFLIKQHYLWDSVAGLVIGLGFYRVYFGLPIWSRNPEKMVSIQQQG